MNIPGGMNMVRIMEQTITDFQVFRVATVTTMVVSTTLATTVTGGLLRRAHPSTPGTAAWITATATCTWATTISGWL